MRLRKSSGLVLNLSMDEGSGTVVGDSSRYGNDGALTGCKWVEKGLEFNGSSDYVYCGNDASLDITDAITLMGWVNSEDLTSTQVIVGNNFSSSYGYEVHINTNAAIVYKTSQAAANQYTVSSNGDIATDTWYNIIITRSEADADIYINGILSTSSHGNHIDPVTSSLPLRVGTYRDIGSYFNGIIDDVRIYNRALTAREIKKHYDSTKYKYL